MHWCNGFTLLEVLLILRNVCMQFGICKCVSTAVGVTIIAHHTRECGLGVKLTLKRKGVAGVGIEGWNQECEANSLMQSSLPMAMME